jgi:DNA invertase Pin-like site-specific DNA recombinase
MKVYIYLRCSTEQQSTDTHESEIKDYCIKNELKYDKRHIYRDQTISGNKPWTERKIKDIIDKCKKGDHIVVSEMSRLSRRARDLHNIVAICDEKGICLHCIKESFKNDKTMTSIMMLGMLSTMSQMEREFAVARSKTALETKRRKGIRLGAELSCPLDKRRGSIEVDIKEGKLTMTEMAKKYETTYSVFHGYALRRNLIQTKGPKIDNVKIPKKSPTGKKCRGSKYDPYIDQINKELKDPKQTLKGIADKYGFKLSGFKAWYYSRCQVI